MLMIIMIITIIVIVIIIILITVISIISIIIIMRMIIIIVNVLCLFVCVMCCQLSDCLAACCCSSRFQSHKSFPGGDGVQKLYSQVQYIYIYICTYVYIYIYICVYIIVQSGSDHVLRYLGPGGMRERLFSLSKISFGWDHTNPPHPHHPLFNKYVLLCRSY